MSDWQPISTAPKDGTRILLYRPGSYPWAAVVAGEFDLQAHYGKPRPYWTHDRERMAGVQEARNKPPTHWMPLPAPPSTPTA